MSTSALSASAWRGPEWTEHAIGWLVYPLGFAGVPVRDPHAAIPEPRALPRLLGWLDHVVNLGCSMVLLGPIFSSATHGYDTLDHFSIDPRLGSEADFDALVQACHQRGLRVVLDGVFSHVGRDHPWVRAALAPDAGPADRERIDLEVDASGTPRPKVFEGHDSLPRLNHASATVRDQVVAVMTHWLDRGADGWRLDAAYSVPVEFWADVLPRVREHHRQAWFFGEVIHGDYPAIVEQSTMDTLTQYELWKAIWSALKDENFYELAWALKRHDEFTAVFCPQTFIGNHDVTRIASMVGPDKAALALVVLLTVAGIPSIYYGDDLGLTGIKAERIGGDDEIRPEFAAQLALNADEQPWVRLHQELIGLRRRHPWLVRATTEVEQLSNTSFGYRAVSPEGDDWLRVELRLEPQLGATVSGPSGTLWSR